MNGLSTECMNDATVKHVLMYCCKYRDVEESERLMCRVIGIGYGYGGGFIRC